ncbi:Histidine kinase [Micromonospora noduli]|nr:Histidine kinase [Micromonospora noduli]
MYLVAGRGGGGWGDTAQRGQRAEHRRGPTGLRTTELGSTGRLQSRRLLYPTGEGPRHQHRGGQGHVGDRAAIVAGAQEALTNVLRHAGVASAEVTVDYRVDEVTVEVTDRGMGADRAGTAPADDEGGHGLAGMRERVAALGGRLTTGPRAGGGFRVYAALPLEPTT